MRICYLFAAVAFALSPVLIQAAQNRFMLEIHNYSCQSFTNHLKQLKCAFTKVAKGRYLLSGQLMYDRNFGKDIDMHVRLRITPWKGKKSFNFLDFKTNMCAMTSQGVSNILTRNLNNELIRTSNYPLDCSYKANFLYKVENYSLTDEMIPAYAPYLNATYSVDFSRNSQLEFNAFGHYSLMPKGKD